MDVRIPTFLLSDVTPLTFNDDNNVELPEINKVLKLVLLFEFENAVVCPFIIVLSRNAELAVVLNNHGDIHVILNGLPAIP